MYQYGETVIRQPKEMAREPDRPALTPAKKSRLKTARGKSALCGSPNSHMAVFVAANHAGRTNYAATSIRRSISHAPLSEFRLHFGTEGTIGTEGVVGNASCLQLRKHKSGKHL
jgi:hypothetical protein